MTFTLFSVPAGGSAIAGPQTHSPVTVSNGLFSLALNFGAGVFDGADRWLEIGVRSNGLGAFTALVPRQPITATPYAVRAANFSGSVAASQITGTILSSNIAPGSISSDQIAAGAAAANLNASG